MKRGPKPDLPAERIARGTLSPSAAPGVELIEPHAMPAQPDWLTAEGEEIWMDDIGRVTASRMATEKDSTQFANYCNLQGAINKAWREGECPAGGGADRGPAHGRAVRHLRRQEPAAGRWRR